MFPIVGLLADGGKKKRMGNSKMAARGRKQKATLL
jgi:hypothetical protein